MDELIRDLEAATEGSRELDLSVAESLGKDWSDNRLDLHGPLRDFEKREGRLPYDDISMEWLPDFTTSLDTALSLAGNFWLAALLYALGRASAYFVNFADKGACIMKKVILWVCIAALKARNHATPRAAATADD